MSTRGVTFNTSDLETAVPGLKIVGLPDRPPQRDLNLLYIAQTDRRTDVSNFYTSRKVNIQCEIGQDTRALLDDALDTLNKILAPKEKTLVVPYGSTTRQYTATFSNMSKTNMSGGFVELDLEFECSDSMGYDTASTTLVSHLHNVAASKSYGFDLGGSAEWQYPVITVTINSLLGGTSKAITLGAHNTNQSVTVTRTWSALDILIIDTVNQTVQVNGVDVAFTGALPIFKLPSGQLDYSDTIDHRDVDVGMTYQRRYI